MLVGSGRKAKREACKGEGREQRHRNGYDLVVGEASTPSADCCWIRSGLSDSDRALQKDTSRE